MTLTIIIAYLTLLLLLGVFSTKLLQRTSGDYFLASRTIGPFMLLMSLFGTTMTAFALVGSTGEAYAKGIGVYGLMASWSGIVHSAVFFIVGVRVWAFGKRFGHLTQLAFFRDRYQSELLALVLFPVVVGLVGIYILMGILAAGTTLYAVTDLPNWAGMLLICAVVLFYVFFGGLRATAWANTFQTLVFMILGIITFWVIASSLGGPAAASGKVLEVQADMLAREGHFTRLQFFSYCLIPLSVGMFPHLFQHWLTARSARSFRLSVIAHPIFIMIVWVPCVLIGVWAHGADLPAGTRPNQVLGALVDAYANPALSGLLTAGILAAIMSSMDSQFLCISSMFANDIVVHLLGHDRVSERGKVLLGRVFVVAVVAVAYLLALEGPRSVFQLGVWCFTGFASLFPIVFAAVYWRRSTKWGAMASVLTVGVLTFWLFREAKFGADREYLFELAGWQMMPVVPIFVASAVVHVVVSLVTPPPAATVLARFFDRRSG